jgi:FkbM family methyltransferase
LRLMKLYSPLQIANGVCRRLRQTFKPSPDRFLKKCKAIIHVGANDGGERDLYASLSLSVIWVEALPEVFQTLKENLREYPEQSAINALLTDSEGKLYDFNVSNNSGASSSIYHFAGHKALWPEVSFTKTIQVSSRTLASVLRDAGRSLAEFDALILDVQGAELLVLAGAGDSLTDLRFIKAEASDFEAYRGACTLDTLSAFLAERGFKLIQKDRFANRKDIGSYYNLLYERIGQDA